MSDALVRTVQIDVDERLLEVWRNLQQRMVVEAGTGCHLLMGSVDRWGYSQSVTISPGTARRPHRIAFVVAAQRDITPGYTIGHACHDAAAQAGECSGGNRCRHRRCINPEHLVEQTMRENTFSSPHARSADRNHCRFGHELSLDNLLPSALKHGSRSCATCAARRAAETYRLIREARTVTGLTHGEYLKQFGSSRKTAIKIIEEQA